MAAVVKLLVLVYLRFNGCYCSPTTELSSRNSHVSFESLFNIFSHADRNMAENLIVRLKVPVDSVHRLDDSLDRGAQANGLPPVSWDFFHVILIYMFCFIVCFHWVRKAPLGSGQLMIFFFIYFIDQPACNNISNVNCQSYGIPEDKMSFQGDSTRAK